MIGCRRIPWLAGRDVRSPRKMFAMSDQVKPRLFIGSSVESLDVAYALQENLEFSAEVTVWSQGLFDLTRSALHSLLEAIGTFDFAAFVFTPDDVAKIRDETIRIVRDNIVFELGLFLGELGEDRVFIVSPRSATDLHLPTDIAGIIPGTYEPNRSDQNTVAALGPAATKIRRALQTVGPRPSAQVSAGVSAPVASGLSDELLEEIGRLMKKQNTQIAKALGRFEQRLAAVGDAQSRIAKAPLSRVRQAFREQLSPSAKSVLRAIVRGHLTAANYEQLFQTDLKIVLEELRRENFLVPLSSRNATGEKILVYWYPPDAAAAIMAVAGVESESNAEMDQVVRTHLQRVGYRHAEIAPPNSR